VPEKDLVPIIMDSKLRVPFWLFFSRVRMITVMLVDFFFVSDFVCFFLGFWFVCLFFLVVVVFVFFKFLFFWLFVCCCFCL
jgi:hypothetical protein